MANFETNYVLLLFYNSDMLLLIATEQAAEKGPGGNHFSDAPSRYKRRLQTQVGIAHPSQGLFYVRYEHDSPLLDRRPSRISSPKVRKEIFHYLQFQNVSNDRCVLHGLRNDREELSKQVDQSVQLKNHPYHSPPHHHQSDSTKEANDASDAISSRKETKGSRWANC